MSVQTIDDRDGVVEYSTGWELAGSSNEHRGTTHFATVAGAIAKLTFKGTSVAVYGTTRSPLDGTVSPRSSYTVDGNGLVTYTSPENGTNQYRQLFYQSPTLSNREHTLTVTNLRDSDAFFLDYFVVVEPDETPVTPPSSPVTPIVTTTITTNRETVTDRVFSTNTTTVVPITTLVSGNTSTSSVIPSGDVPEKSSSSSNPNRTAIITGGIGGAVCGTILLVIVILLCVRRRRRKAILERDAQAVTSFPAEPIASPMISRNKNVPTFNRPFSTSMSSSNPSSNYGSQDAYAQDAFVAYDNGRTLQPQQPFASHSNQGPSYYNSPLEPPCYPSEPPSYFQCPSYGLPAKLRDEYHRIHGTNADGTVSGGGSQYR